MKWANHIAAAATLIAALAATTVRAQVAAIPIPGHPDVPVIIDGRNATYRLVLGDWGLSRPGAVPVRVFGPPVVSIPADGVYYPSEGRPPAYGRREIVPHRRVLPPPAPTYYRHWSAASRPLPASTQPAPRVPEVAVEARRHR
jgi:hypothetical protein